MWIHNKQKYKEKELQNRLNLSFADDICDYFGVKIGMYFAWLGFYTNSMLYPAVIGFLLWILAEADQVSDGSMKWLHV